MWRVFLFFSPFLISITKTAQTLACHSYGSLPVPDTTSHREEWGEKEIDRLGKRVLLCACMCQGMELTWQGKPLTPNPNLMPPPPNPRPHPSTPVPCWAPSHLFTRSECGAPLSGMPRRATNIIVNGLQMSRGGYFTFWVHHANRQPKSKVAIDVMNCTINMA